MPIWAGFLLFALGELLGFVLAAALCGQGRNHGERDV